VCTRGGCSIVVFPYRSFRETKVILMLLQSRVTMNGGLLDNSESMIDVGIQVSLKYE
jgi:hypothetical protein